MFVKRGRFFRGLVTVGGEWKAIAKLFRNQWNKGTLTDRAESSWSMRFNSAANLYLLAFVTGYCDRLRHRATISHFLSYPYSFLYCFFFFLRFFLSRKVLFYLACLEEDYSKRIRFQIVWQVRWIFSLLCKLLFSYIFMNIQIYRYDSKFWYWI